MQLKNLNMSFGTEEIYSDINLFIPENEKVGIVGVNGAGKTTLFKLIMKELEPDSGKLVINSKFRVAYLPQVIDDEVLNHDTSVFDYLVSARPIEKLEKEMQNLYEMLPGLSDNEALKIYDQIDKIRDKLDYWDEYSSDTILLKIIAGMGISDEILDHSLKSLSGGQKSKVSFARLLYSKPEIILLDEPTNHLDASTKDYVINYLKNYKGSVYVISHDIDFLNSVTSKTLFLDKRIKQMKLYDGNYEYYKKVSAEQEKALLREAERQEAEETKLKAIVELYSNSSGKRKKMAQDREKKLEKLREHKIEIVKPTKSTKFEIEIGREDSNIPLRVTNLKFRYDKTSEDYLINDLTFDIVKGEKLLIVGENGVGKSTLAKLIVGTLKPDAGQIELGNKTDLGYYAQEHELLDNSKNILDNFREFGLSERQIRSVLGRFLFFRDDVYKLVSVLSPGEKSRVALAKLTLKKANFLILDEPTNHLDPETQKIIADSFKDFKGTMLVISHNPEFVDNLEIKKMLVLPDCVIREYSHETVEYYQNLFNKR